MRPYPNTILARQRGVKIDIAAQLKNCATTWTERRKQRFRINLMRHESAREAISSLEHDTRVFGFTKGQFSLVQLIEATLAKIGPADLCVSTWAAATADTNDLLDLLRSKDLRSVRLLVDPSLFRRKPEVAKAIIAAFGKDSLRVANNHAKLFTLGNDVWHVVCHTSMNLNQNDRFEDFSIEDNEKFFRFQMSVFDAIWAVRKDLFADRKEDWFDEF